MHEQSAFFSAPVLSGVALALIAAAFGAEMTVRADDQSGIVRTIASDDQQEIERIVTSDIDADYQADLLAIVQDPSLTPLTADTLRGTVFFRTADEMDRPKFQAYVGGLLAKRKRHEEALSVLSALSPEQRIEHGSSFAYAQSYRGAGNTPAAIDAYAVHLAANPNHNPGYVNYGILLAETDRHEEAIRVFERSVEITSSSRKGKSLSLLGQSQMTIGAYEDAIKSFDKSIQFRPDSGPTWRRFATAKMKAGTYDATEIEADYRRALALAPDSAPTLKDWAEFNFSYGRFEPALPMFRSASEIASSDFDILFSRSVNLLASERPRAARQIIDRMSNIEMSAEQESLLLGLQEASGVIRPPTIETRDSTCEVPTEDERRTYLCLLLNLVTDDMDGAISALESLPETSIFTQPAAFALARYEYRQGSAETASERLDVLLTKNPQSSLFWLYKARALALLEKNEDALIAFQSALDLNPESRKITFELSEHLAQMEAYEEAEQILVAYSALKPNDASALMELARIHSIAGSPEKAEETLLQLVSMSDEGDAETIEQLVSVQVALEKYADALENADTLLEQDPANVAVRERRVEALLKLGNQEEADAEMERIRKLTPIETAEESGTTELASVAP